MEGLIAENRPVPVIVLENVVGTISANQGKDFLALLKVLADAGYRVGPMVIDGQYFVPQSRPRLFVVAISREVDLSSSIIQQHPDRGGHREQLLSVHISQCQMKSRKPGFGGICRIRHLAPKAWLI